MLTILLLTLAANPAPSLPVPKFAVENDYAAIREKVAKGATYTIYAGVPLPANAEPNAVRVDAIPGEPAGVYDCRTVNGVPVMVTRTRPVVATPTRTVPGHEHRCSRCGTVWAHADNDPSASHNCPACGRVQTAKFRSVPVEVRPAARPKRISLNGRWYDEYPDGRRVECAT